MNLKINIPKDLKPFVDAALQASGSAAASANDYVSELVADEFQAKLDARVIEIASSWRPVDAPEVAARKEAVASKLKDIPLDKLEAIEAALAAEAVVGPVEEEIKP